MIIQLSKNSKLQITKNVMSQQLVQMVLICEQSVFAGIE